MKWVLIGVGVLVVLVAVVALIGAFIPREHVASSGAVIHRSPDSVWQVIRDQGGLGTWWTAMKQSRRVEDAQGREVWEQTMGGFTMRGIITESTPPRRMVMTIDSPPNASFGGAWIYEIEPVEGGSRVRITERGWIANPIFRFMTKFVFGYHGTQESYLKALGRKFGEKVPTERET